MLTVAEEFKEPIRGTTSTPETEYAQAEQRAIKTTIGDIMQLCGVSDMDNRRVLTSEVLKHDLESVQDEMDRFASEMRQGEHNNARKPVAIFMKRLQALPTVKYG